MDFISILALLLIGLSLVALETAITPGFGFPGVVGVVLLFAGVVWTFVAFGPAAGGLTLAGSLLALLFGVWLFPKTPVGQALVLHQTQAGETAQAEDLRGLLGQVGYAETPLRPSGSAYLGHGSFDVVTTGVFVEAGQKVRVVQVEGARVVVEPLAS